IENSTQAQTALSRVVNFVDLSSLSLILGKNAIFLIVVFLAILIDFLVVLILICITMIDCYDIVTTNEAGEEIRSSYWRAASDNVCMSNIYQIVGLILAVITFIVLLVYCLTIDLLIFNFNPKNGGLFSCPNGFFNFIQHLFITIVVFTQRFLYQWEFWRGVASVGVSIAIIVYIIYKQPFYNIKSNFMAQIPWIIFGSVRLCAEIGYLFEGIFNSYIPQIILILFSVVIIVMRFRTPEMMLYAEVIFTQSVRTHQKNAQILFNFWNFIIYFRKNFQKAEAILKLINRCHLNFLMKFIIFSFNKQKEHGIGIADKENFKSENSIAFRQKFEYAHKSHERAKHFTIQFFHLITSNISSFEVVYECVYKIAKFEAKARTAYEDLLNEQPNNVTVLKQYALLLSDIYRDEDSAEMILSRAQIQEGYRSTIEFKEERVKNEQTPTLSRFNTQIQLENDKENLIRSEAQTPLFAKTPHQKGSLALELAFKKLYRRDLLLTLGLYAEKAILEIREFEQYMPNDDSIVCSFNYKGLNDGESEFLTSWDFVNELLISISDKITQTLEDIYTLMADTSQWEIHNVVVQEFDIRLDLEGTEQSSSTQSSSYSFPSITHDEPIQYSNQEQNISLIRALTLLVQKSREMAVQPYREEIGTGDLPHITNINFYSDIAYVCFNSIQPVFAACQRVLVNLQGDIQNQRVIISATYISIVVISQIIIIILSSLVVLHEMFDANMERFLAMVKLLNIPKSKLQQYYRRLTTLV
ncbi:MAG: hypothetical protein EZS28_015816, partial [Streblomastix strix]